MMGLAASWLFQKPSSPIFASSSLRRFCFVGRSKRVPDGDHPGRKRFDRGREVFVNHGLTLGSEGENANGAQSSSAYSRTGMLTPLGVGVAAGSSTIGTSSSTRTIAISSQPSRLGQRTQSDQTFSGRESFGTTSKLSFSKKRCS